MSNTDRTRPSAMDKTERKMANVGAKVMDKVSKAAEYVKDAVGMDDSEGVDRGFSGIKEHMDVIASCGTRIGRVDGLEGDAIKLTRSDSPNGMHYYIPKAWVDRVDSHVHLTKDSVEAMRDWKTNSSSCSCH